MPYLYEEWTYYILYKIQETRDNLYMSVCTLHHLCPKMSLCPNGALVPTSPVSPNCPNSREGNKKEEKSDSLRDIDNACE